jgi:beta-N-acetylhexosaminidase
MTAPGRGATILGCLSTTLSPDETAFFREADPFGFILFARNIDTPDQVRRLTSDLRHAVGRDAPVFVDQEGGRVQRLRGPHWREWDAPLDTVRRFGSRAAAALTLRYRWIAAELRAIGIDGNCAPCLDLARTETHPFLRNRCLGSEPVPVAALGRAVAEAHLAGGVLPVIKHMPGHGRAVTDSHHALPHTDADPAELHATDFAAFAPLADLPLAMTGHVVFDRIAPGEPATTSARIVALIRQNLKFDGLLMTDDLSMQALSGDLGQRAAAAVAAGCDIALHCNGKREEAGPVVAAAGRLTPAATARAIRALSMRRPAPEVDFAALEADLRGLEDGGLGG